LLDGDQTDQRLDDAGGTVPAVGILRGEDLTGIQVEDHPRRRRLILRQGETLRGDDPAAAHERATGGYLGDRQDNRCPAAGCDRLGGGACGGGGLQVGAVIGVGCPLPGGGLAVVLLLVEGFGILRGHRRLRGLRCGRVLGGGCAEGGRQGDGECGG